MKRLPSLLTCLAAAVAFLAGCEQHPASQTHPELRKQEAHSQADAQEKPHTPAGTGTNAPAPAYFPPKGQ